MKISICIPVYNFDVRELVFSLKKEIEKFQINAEIILIDDASKEEFKNINLFLKEDVNQFIFLEKNIGRSAIRNLFLKYTSGDFLLFLDCDAKIISQNFIKNYLDFVIENPNAEVIYGGRIPNKMFPSKEYRLRWKYSKERESQPVEKRKKCPYLSFQSNNFLIRRNIFEKNEFNKDLKNYGYEDLIFSLTLKREKINIFHINNNISNKDLETNNDFIMKSEEAAINLSFLYKSSYYNEIISEIKLIRFYEICRFWKFEKIFLLFFKSYKNNIRTMIDNKNVSLKLLDIYKLGIFMENI